MSLYRPFCVGGVIFYDVRKIESTLYIFTKINGTEVYFFCHTSLSVSLSLSIIYWGFIFDLFPGPFLSYYVINMKINNYTIIHIVMYIYMRSLSKSFVICFLFKHLSNNNTLVTDSIDRIISIIINDTTNLELFNEMFRNNPYRPMKENT